MYFFALILHLLFLHYNVQAGVEIVSFDQSIYANNHLPKNPLYQQLSHLYAQNNPGKLKPLSEPLIPKKIHQTWVGPLQIPEEYIEYSKTWQKLHPDWEYKLWRDEDVENWDFPNKDLYNKASTYQEKSNILRYEILNKYGGLYVDVEYKALKKFDDLHYLYNFYAGILPPLANDNEVVITSAVIGSQPNNPILHQTLAKIRECWDAVEAGFREEAKHLGRKGAIVNLSKNRTMMSFNQAIINTIFDVDRAIIFPPTYFNIEAKPRILDSFKRFSNIAQKKIYFRTIHPETMSVQDSASNKLFTNLSNIEIEETWYQSIINKVEEFFS
jgi:hypothetical protein